MPRVLYCHCAHSDSVPPETKNCLLDRLCGSGLPFDAVPDLCELAARCDPLLDRYRRATRIAACYPRAVKWLFARARRRLAENGGSISNMRGSSAEEILESFLQIQDPPSGGGGDSGGDGAEGQCRSVGSSATSGLRVVLLPDRGDGSSVSPGIVRVLLEQGYPLTVAKGGGDPPVLGESLVVLGVRGSSGAPPDLPEGTPFREIHGLEPREVVEVVEAARTALGREKPGTWPPWFPVIDYDRCTDCRQCLSFCLFGVYGVSTDGRIDVENPEKCKNKCPACARVCPELAIMFPKYEEGPLSGAEGVEQQEVGRASFKVDLSSLVQSDVYSTLRNRGKRTRFSLDEREERAREERRRCACTSELTERLGIPLEVLESLTPEEIARGRSRGERIRHSEGAPDTSQEAGEKGPPSCDRDGKDCCG